VQNALVEKAAWCDAMCYKGLAPKVTILSTPLRIRSTAKSIAACRMHRRKSCVVGCDASAAPQKKLTVK